MRKQESSERPVSAQKFVTDQLLVISGIAVIALLGLAYYLFVVRHLGQPKDSAVTVVSPSVSATASTTSAANFPVVTTSASPTNALPGSLQAVIANFYAAYEARDSVRLEAAFTVDASTANQNTFFGISSPSGTGLPVLFTTPTLQERVVGYTITTATQTGSNWVVSVIENRTTGDGSQIAPEVNLLTFVSADQDHGGWLLDSYTHSGATGKYNAFFTE